MKIVNKTKKTIVSEAAEICTSYLAKAQGLMFSKKRELIFVFNKERKVSLHMWFVFFPIDVVFLDKNKKVVEIKEKLLPFSWYVPKNKAQYVLELSEGTVARSKTQINHQVVFE